MRINSTSINDNDIKLANMVVIVGSNGTGKTRLIEELNYAFTKRINGNVTQFWKIGFVEQLTASDIRKWLANLVFHVEASNSIWTSPFTRWHNQPDGLSIPDNQYQQYVNMTDEELVTNFNSKEFIKELTNYLQVNERLGTQSSAAITPPTQKIADILNLLFRNKKLFDEINGELGKLFKKSIVLSPHNFPNLELKIIDQDTEKPTNFDINNLNQSFHDYIKWKESNHVGEIYVEGHGIQAFLQIMLTYCIPVNDVLLIDEPEIHLYPSVKRKFGNALGEISKKNQKQFFCVTHDSDFLQGVFDSKCEATIIKIKKNGKKREIIHKHFDKDAQYLAGQNQTPFLQIPFLDAAIIVEGSTDRLVYEHVFFENKFLNDIEYKFISSGGKDSISNPARIANDLKVPYAIILDIENLKDKDNAHLLKLTRVQEVSGLQEEITELGPKLKGISNFLTSGLDAITDTGLRGRTEKLINFLKGIGIFIVHRGTLESWGQVSSEKKNMFPERFIEEYSKNKEAFKEMTEFLKGIETYIKKQ